MITGGSNSNTSSGNYEPQKFVVTDAGGEDTFVLPFPLTENNLVFVGGIITDIPYIGLGTDTIVFSQPLYQGEIIHII